MSLFSKDYFNINNNTYSIKDQEMLGETVYDIEEISESIILTKYYIDQLIIEDLENQFNKFDYEVIITSINYNIVETVSDSYFTSADVLITYKKIKK